MFNHVMRYCKTVGCINYTCSDYCTRCHLEKHDAKMSRNRWKKLWIFHDSLIADKEPQPDSQTNVSNTSAPEDTVSPLTSQVGGDHYSKLTIQPVEYIHKNKILFIEGSVIKYVTRWRDKGGIKDLEKAKHFIELLIELENVNVRKTD